jgi:pyrroloquinoline quinone biosynthesis protein B
MRVLVLGSAAGGGLPQWNCNCDNCRAARQGDLHVPPRNQPSLAISSDGERWHLLNAGPDIRQQINDNPALHPRNGLRHTPIRSIILTNADIDHIAGLLILREARPYTIFSTPWLKRVVLESNAAFRLLVRKPEPVKWVELSLERPFFPEDESRIQITPFPVPGKVPLYLQDDYENHPEATIGLNIRDLETDKVLVFVPGVQDFSPLVHAQIDQADVLFMDGTTFTDTEMRDLGIAHAPTARVMGHWPVGGEDGTVALLRGKPDIRKVFIHINNTNPILRDDSPQAEFVRNSGWEISYEGMTLDL